MDATGPVAEALDEIRAQGYLDGPVPRLLAVVDATLDLVDEWVRQSASLDERWLPVPQGGGRIHSGPI